MTTLAFKIFVLWVFFMAFTFIGYAMGKHDQKKKDAIKIEQLRDAIKRFNNIDLEL